MKKIFRLERQLIRYMRPMAKRFSDVPLPEDDYFASLEKLFERLQGVDRLLNDPQITTVRLVSNLEKMVLRETQRAFMFFSLHELSLDAVILNRVFSGDPSSEFFAAWQQSQNGYLELAKSYFHPIPLFQVPYYQAEVLGYDRLRRLGQELYAGRNPADIFHLQRPFKFHLENGKACLTLHMPFVQKNEIDLTKVGEELVIRIGNFKKKLILPRSYVPLEAQNAELKGDYLSIHFGENHARRNVP